MGKNIISEKVYVSDKESKKFSYYITYGLILGGTSGIVIGGLAGFLGGGPAMAGLGSFLGALLGSVAGLIVGLCCGIFYLNYKSEDMLSECENNEESNFGFN